MIRIDYPFSIQKTLIRTFFTPLLHDPRHRLLIGSALAQAVLFAGMAGISRLYEAGPIGVWSTYIAFVNLVWSFSQLKTDVALVQAQDTGEKHQLLQFGLLSHLFFSGIALALARGFGLFPDTNNILIFSVLASHAIQQMYSSWCLSAHAYPQVNWMRLSNVLLAYPGSLLFFFWSGTQGLLWALLVGNLLPALSLIVAGKIPLPGAGVSVLSWRALIRKHLQTLSYLSAGNFLLSLSDQGMVLLISVYYHPALAAAYFLAARVCNLPLSFVQNAMGQYNLRRFQDLFSAGTFSSQVVRAYWKKWLPAGLLYFLPVIVAGPWLFSLVFGDTWDIAGRIASILAVLAFAHFLSSPTSMGFFAVGKQRIFFLFSLLFTLNFGVSLLLAYLQYPLFQVIATNSLCQVLVIVGYNWVMLKEIDRDSL